MKGNIKQGQELDALIDQLTSVSMAIAIHKDDLDYLHQAKAILKRRIKSFPMEGETRVDSVIREFNEYGNIDPSLYNKLIIQLVTSSAYPLMMDELNKIVFYITIKFSPAEFLFSVVTDERLDEKILLQLVCSCQE